MGHGAILATPYFTWRGSLKMWAGAKRPALGYTPPKAVENCLCKISAGQTQEKRFTSMDTVTCVSQKLVGTRAFSPGHSV